MIGIATVKKIMRSATDKPISTRAAFILAERLEQIAKEKTREAENLLKERNNLREKQGIRGKERISGELVKEVLGDDQ